MIVLVDADSLIFASCYKNKQEKKIYPYYETIEECELKFDQSFMSIINSLEETFEIQKLRVFSGRSKNNFRKLLCKTYKANRTNVEKPPMLDQMHEYVKTQYEAITSCGHETDDAVAKYWYESQKIVGKDNVIIVSIDKDYRQFPALIYNYHIKHKKIEKITEQQALYNFYEQMIVGDTADNVNYFYGLGKKFTEKYLKDCTSKYQYVKKVYKLFRDRYRQKGKEKYIECYNLLKLRTDV